MHAICVSGFLWNEIIGLLVTNTWVNLTPYLLCYSRPCSYLLTKFACPQWSIYMPFVFNVLWNEIIRFTLHGPGRPPGPPRRWWSLHMVELDGTTVPQCGAAELGHTSASGTLHAAVLCLIILTTTVVGVFYMLFISWPPSMFANHPSASCYMIPT